MLKTRKEKIKVVKELLQQHKALSPQLFDNNGLLLPSVRKKLLNLAEYIKIRYLPVFPQSKIEDIRIVGSSCGYNYREYGDLDFFIILDKIFPEQQERYQSALRNFNSFLVRQPWQPVIHNHKLDFSIMDTTNVKGLCRNNYSVLKDEWVIKPVYKKFPFTAEELFQKYCKFSAELHNFVSNLEKKNDVFLTRDSCLKLSAYLNDIRNKAYNYDVEYEYSEEYNIYRLAKRFGTYMHFNKYINDSMKYLMRNTPDEV